MDKILVLGSKGMLGQMVFRYFNKKYQVFTFDEKYTFENRVKYLKEIKSFRNAYIINCVGKIKQKNSTSESLFLINSLLPIDLYANLEQDQILIHPSTDCVFSGNQIKNSYRYDQKPDAVDEYGQSKYLSEIALSLKKNVYITRVSIIGPDNNLIPKGLLGWFLSNKNGSTLKGYINHFWNGITTLEWCKFVEMEIMSGAQLNNQGKILQLGTSRIYSKYDMLVLFQEFYKTDFKITQHNDQETFNRALEPQFECVPLDEQLFDLISFEKSSN
jgi:dTDP-4-dehydrorhamnose reductase